MESVNTNNTTQIVTAPTYTRESYNEFMKCHLLEMYLNLKNPNPKVISTEEYFATAPSWREHAENNHEKDEEEDDCDVVGCIPKVVRDENFHKINNVLLQRQNQPK
eukprot:TRINITY_DN1411_c0_g1_i4.p1 TRINITY_DN1411_c0_g1~~TRINITY_DN1411_c0_g1_i4.p1  ORF type:complete len:106 (-),score=17.64 TRINITY_DN1411_c0_g1_i4:4-321(-)